MTLIRLRRKKHIMNKEVFRSVGETRSYLKILKSRAAYFVEHRLRHKTILSVRIEDTI